MSALELGLEVVATKIGVPLDILKGGLMLTSAYFLAVLRDPHSANTQDVIPELQSRAIKKYSSISEFFGYVFFFAAFLVGPAFDFNDYREFTNGEGVFATVTEKGVKKRLPARAAGIVARSKFLPEKPVWNRARNFSILGFELAENPKVLIDNWNMRTGFWLKNCVYLRMVKPGQKPGGLVTFTTFLVSALWHGFHLGYYLTFSMEALYSMVGRTLRRNVRPLFLEPSNLAAYKPAYDFLGWFFTWTSINFIAVPFSLWALDKVFSRGRLLDIML
ncbi:UNVERIFIED_CONTAM: lysophospholipid acyltransferase [Siphonaria sp. JEL0065]|nr:lysophospholipid acyltransferase [Siphonaria sp. JEL0065]